MAVYKLQRCNSSASMAAFQIQRCFTGNGASVAVGTLPNGSDPMVVLLPLLAC